MEDKEAVRIRFIKFLLALVTFTYIATGKKEAHHPGASTNRPLLRPWKATLQWQGHLRASPRAYADDMEGRPGPLVGSLWTT